MHTHTEAQSPLTGESSKMPREYTPTTPADLINAWCGTQTSSFSDSCDRVSMHSTRLMGTASAPSYITHTEARSPLTGESSNMSQEYTTPEDLINAWCGGTQTSSLCDSQTYVQLAEDLLLCSLGATPRANDTLANCKAHAGAARWLQTATVPLDVGVLARSSSMPACVQA
ncbi:hypothetical protein T484DRAFT_1921502 [Baffinella frigidus]|nr:hypothetical protein T484DRAFT_1921502 [Cryptophyta sp. CCMP2293]